MSGATAPARGPASVDPRAPRSGGTASPADPRRVDSALQSRSVRLLASTLVGAVLLAASLEAIRLRSYYEESGWVAKLAGWYERQAAEADQKAHSLRRRAARADDPDEASRLEREAATLERYSESWGRQAGKAREVGARRSFEWLPRAFAGPVGGRHH